MKDEFFIVETNILFVNFYFEYDNNRINHFEYSLSLSITAEPR